MSSLQSYFRQLLACFLLLPSVGTTLEAFSLEWFGHSMIAARSDTGLTVVVDPFGPHLKCYRRPQVRGDLVLVTHRHSDHSFVECVAGDPVVFQGVENGEVLASKMKLISSGEGGRPQLLKGKDLVGAPKGGDTLLIQSIPSYHDRKHGAEKGANAMFLLEVDGTRVLHTGDIGQVELTSEQLEQVGRVDVLVLPVGGNSTIGPKAAIRIIAQTRPSVVVPVHYWVEGLQLNLVPLESFLEKVPVNVEVRRVGGTPWSWQREEGAAADEYSIVLFEPPLVDLSEFASQEVVVSQDVLMRYVGKYELQPGVVMEVAWEQDHLVATPPGSPTTRNRLYARSDSKFVLAVLEVELVFEMDEDGKVKGLVIHQGDRRIVAKRTE